MKLKMKLCLSLLLISTLCLATTAFAASYNFTYNFKHQLAMASSKTATTSTAQFSCTTTSNDGNDTYFTIEQYKYNTLGSNTYITSKNISCGAGVTSTCSFSTTSGTTYTYEFWKPTAIGYVVGSGTLTY